MKKLTILRHGKSSWENPGLVDIDRPLLELGVTRTKKVCKYMQENQVVPDCLLSSPAKRAHNTAGIVIEELKLSLVPQIDKSIYFGDIYKIIDNLANIDNSFGHLLIVGHNPLLTNMINKLANSFYIDWLPTSGLVTLEFEMNQWKSITATKGKCLHNVIPKKL